MEPQTAVIPVLDREYLKVNFHEAGFGYLLPEILELFHGQSVVYLQNIDRFFQDHELQHLSEEAHSLKGTAGSVGAAALAKAANILEKQATIADHNELQKLMADLHEVSKLTSTAIIDELVRLAAEENAALNLL